MTIFPLNIRSVKQYFLCRLHITDVRFHKQGREKSSRAQGRIMYSRVKAINYESNFLL